MIATAWHARAGRLARQVGLYQIGRYCDEMVDDGFGGKEPRFTCNVYLQQAADAYRVVQDFASIFRGMAYWANASVFAAADMPSDPVYTYSSANVVDGKFSYVGSALGTRYTVALVSWNDLSEMGRQKVEYVENREGIARYGIQQVEVTGFGCTSRGQAHRVGKWMLLTSNLETRSVTFSVGLDACRVRPGSIIRAADQHLAGRRIGGRIREATTTVVTVDAELGVRPGDRLTVNLPSGVSETRVVAAAVGTGLTADNTEFTVDTTELTADLVGLPGSVLHITVTAPFSQAPQAECVWTLESEAAAQTFRVLAVKRKEGLVAEISAIQHEPGKFDNVDFGTRLDPKPITVAAVGAGRAAEHPAGLALGHRPGHRAPRGRDSWAAAPSAVAYHVQWRRDNSDWVEAGRTGSLTLELPDIRAGAYVARVRAINVADVSSVWASSTETQLQETWRRRRRWPSWPHNRRCSALACAGDFRKDASPRSAPRSGTARPMTAPARSSWGFRLSAERAHPVRPVGRQALFFWGRIVALNGEIGAWYPDGPGVMGEASWQASEILEYLNGQIKGPAGAGTDLDHRRTDQRPGSGARRDHRREDGAGRRRRRAGHAGGHHAGGGQRRRRRRAGIAHGAGGAGWPAQGHLGVKAQVTKDDKVYAAGMSLGAYTNPDGRVQSSVYFLADRFGFLSLANGAVTTPFVIENGQTVINDAVIGTEGSRMRWFATWTPRRSTPAT